MTLKKNFFFAHAREIKKIEFKLWLYLTKQNITNSINTFNKTFRQNKIYNEQKEILLGSLLSKNSYVTLEIKTVIEMIIL